MLAIDGKLWNMKICEEVRVGKEIALGDKSGSTKEESFESDIMRWGNNCKAKIPIVWNLEGPSFSFIQAFCRRSDGKAEAVLPESGNGGACQC